jgi:hypothetical protein
LSRALDRLEAIAGAPDELLEEACSDVLPRLQYALHAAAELSVGLRPPDEAETVHAELSAALEDARDATAEVAEAVEAAGLSGAEPLIPEWRGALFRVRLARLRLATPRPLAGEPELELKPAAQPPRQFLALAAFVLCICGAVLFAAGATLSVWPAWALGLALFAGSTLVYRPRP